MDGNKIENIEEKTKELDCVIGLHNLKVLRKVNNNYDIPERRYALPEEHVFKPLKPADEVDLKIPPSITTTKEGESKHIRDFERFLPSVAPLLKKAIENEKNESIFYPTVGKRGKNLYEGAYVLQLKLQEEILGVWTINFIVGASYRYDTHFGYFQMSKDNACINCICSCYGG